MLTVTKLLPQGRGLARVLLQRAATVELSWAVRRLHRFDATDSQGRRLGVSLPHGSVVRGGDVLVAEDGSFIRVLASAQPVWVVRHCGEHGHPRDLLRAAYHLGQRHVPLELQTDHLSLEADPELAELLRHWHLTVTEELAPFEPETRPAGALASPAHVHGPECGHAPAPASVPVPAPTVRGRPVGIAVQGAPTGQPHVHGPGCTHGHDH